MKPPERPADPCYYWKEYELVRVAERMRQGQFGTRYPNLTDTQKVQIALLLIARHKREDHFAVWLDEGQLRVRYGLQGSPVPMSWGRAAALVEYFIERPVFRKTVASFCARKSRHKTA